jgi:hypothetical protein
MVGRRTLWPKPHPCQHRPTRELSFQPTGCNEVTQHLGVSEKAKSGYSSWLAGITHSVDKVGKNSHLHPAVTSKPLLPPFTSINRSRVGNFSVAEQCQKKQLTQVILNKIQSPII